MRRSPDLHDYPAGLAGYAPVEWLGGGHRGQVFKAWQQSTRQFVAVKTPRLHTTQEETERFLDEARLCAGLGHPHIAGLIDAGRAAQGRPYAIYEYVPGQTLRQFVMRHGPLDAPMACALMLQLLNALACLHARGVVHRDLKPQNVLVTGAGLGPMVKLIDFGMAARIQSPPGVALKAGGTPGYSAPEQLRGAPPAPAADLFAWGQLFVECLTGRQERASGDSPLEERGDGPVVLAAELRDHALEPVLTAVLQRNPARRPAQASEVHALLQRACELEPVLRVVGQDIGRP